AAALPELGLKSASELYERLGLGERLAPLVARRLLPHEHSGAADAAAIAAEGTGTEGNGTEGALASRGAAADGAGVAGGGAPLAVAGTEGLLVTYANCCHPLPHEPILAFLSTGRGIVIHRATCGNVED